MSDSNDEPTGGEDTPRKGPSLLVLLPLVIFAGMVALFFYQLSAGRDPSILPSALIHKQAPQFDLGPLPGVTLNGKEVPGLKRADLDGKVTLLNFWASWCVPCRQEHPILLELQKDSRFQLVGINVRDSETAARGYLVDHENPFERIGFDTTYRSAIEFGVTGQPETFIIDKFGCIRHKQIGPLYTKLLNDTVLPLIDKALGETEPAEGCTPPTSAGS
ncbi:MAG: DsbE family thiol:disulfide interchange protein [Hyphomicrobiales bacterium]|nr:MAG: DsbE family thiol:disulfide interchange protein [Hyphomicrobiales bacterium]